MSAQTEPTLHVTWSKVFAVITAIVIPGLSLLITGVIFGTNLINKVDGISSKVDVISIRQDKIDDKVDHVSSRVDTIERRQAIYQATHK